MHCRDFWADFTLKPDTSIHHFAKAAYTAAFHFFHKPLKLKTMEKHFFEGCFDLHDLKHRYLAMAKEYHPVTGRDSITLFLCRLQYFSKSQEPLMKFSIQSDGFQLDFLEYPDKIDKLIGWGLKVELLGTWTWVNGNTQPFGERLTEMGFVYENSMKACYSRPMSFWITNLEPELDEPIQESHLLKAIELLFKFN